MVKKLLIFIYFLLGSIFVTFPLVTDLGGFIPSKGDELLITWIINWDIHSFSSNILNIFNANIYYPFNNSLAFSDSFFTSALIAFIPLKIFQEPAVVYNFNLLFTFTTLGFFTYLLTHYLSKDHLSSIVSGTLVSFSTYTLNRTMHLQLVSIEWLPLSLLFFFKFSKNKKTKDLFLCSLFFVIQSFNSFLPMYFLLFCFAIFILYFYFKDKNAFNNFLNVNVLITIVLTIFLILPIAIPYLQVSREYNYVRDIRDSIHFANRPEYTFYPNDKTRLKNIILNTIYKNDNGPYKYDGYLGGTLFILIVTSLVFKLRRKVGQYFNLFFLTGVFSFILSLGPALQWGGKVLKLPFIIPLPYALFYYLIPGFKGFRNSARWEMLAVFSFSVISGLLISEMLKNKSIFTKSLITFIICFLVFLEFNFPFYVEKIPKKEEFPPVYNYLQDIPKSSKIIEFPIYTWRMLPYSRGELIREYYSTLHFKQMVNGGSGFTPPPWEKSVEDIALNFPNKETINYLKSINVSYVIIHSEEYKVLEREKYKFKNKPFPTWQSIENSLNKNSQILLLKKINNDYLYKIK